jgi:hypothetical protein
MIYIRRKDNPLMIRSWGEGDSGALGAFDSALYEEVIADDLPENWILEEPPVPIETKLQLLYKSLAIDVRAQSVGIFTTTQLMIQLDDLEGAQAYLEASSLPADIKMTALSYFIA